ncbi:hypothetical protein D3C85_1285950 [compost metagenome]
MSFNLRVGSQTFICNKHVDRDGVGSGGMPRTPSYQRNLQMAVGQKAVSPSALRYQP